MKSYILIRSSSDEVFAQSQKWTLEVLYENLNRITSKSQKIRGARIKPFTDKKTITSWNALMVSALLDAYEAFSKSIIWNWLKRT
ncbi:MAG: hypothetical protein QNL61_08545 [Crocinitomicaceae bacterium]